MNENNKLIRNSTAEFLIFTAQSGEQSIEARYQDEIMMDATIRKFRIVQTEGLRQVTRNVDFYNLDAIILVGYRVNSLRATQFRQWAIKVLSEFTIKGYVLDKKRLENGSYLNESYFEELLAEIREIRLSVRKLCQKITDIYATSLDYNKDAVTTQLITKRKSGVKVKLYNKIILKS